jgi:hypothetical protein
MVEVDIYMNNIIKFFKENRKDLLNLITEDKEEQFYSKIREIAIKNFENGEEVSLTQKQMIQICSEIHKKIKILIETPYGGYSLN